MKMLRKSIDWESLKIFQEKFYNGVFFSKVTKSTVFRQQLYHKENSARFFLEYVPKNSCLKKNNLIENPMVDQHLDKVAAS